MSYIEPKLDFKDGDVLHGNDLNASNAVIKAGVDDNFDRIQGLETDKQDVLTAGEGISIENNVISNTQTSAEWGNVQGDITEQTDLMDALAAKQDVIDSSHKLDYGLLSNTPNIPSKTSDLTNDSGFVADANYTHTDNNYTNDEKSKLSGIESGAEENTIETIKVDSTALTPDADKAVNIDLSGKQDTLISGTTIKTINNQSILGSGNISVGGGSGGTSDYDQLENRPQINSVTLTGNKSLSDLGINIPTKTSDLNNDSNFVVDASYVHTDSNYTAAEKTKLSGIESGAEVNDIDTIKVNGTAQTITNKAVDLTVPTKLSDLNNDNNTVMDALYVHTDNNYTNTEKSKLYNIEPGAQVNVDEIALEANDITADTKLYIESTDLDFQGLEISNTKTTGDNVAYSADYSNSAFGGKILWTNPNPTSDMSSGTVITLSSSDYDVLEIYYKAGISNNVPVLDVVKTIKGNGGRLCSVVYGGGGIESMYRDLTYTSDTSFTTNDCRYGRSVTVYNSGCIPLYIIGYKTGLFS